MDFSKMPGKGITRKSIKRGIRRSNTRKGIRRGNTRKGIRRSITRKGIRRGNTRKGIRRSNTRKGVRRGDRRGNTRKGIRRGNRRSNKYKKMVGGAYDIYELYGINNKDCRELRIKALLLFKDIPQSFRNIPQPIKLIFDKFVVNLNALISIRWILHIVPCSLITQYVIELTNSYFELYSLSTEYISEFDISIPKLSIPELINKKKN